MFVSIVVLCSSERVNELKQRLDVILKRVSFSCELIFVFRSRSVYLEKRPKDGAKFVCVQNFWGTRKQIKKVLDEITGKYVAVLSPDIKNSPYYMVDSLELMETNSYDMVTLIDEVLPYSVIQKLMMKVKYVLFPTKIFYVCKKELLEKKVLKKDISHCSVYYLPYEIEK